MCVHMEEFNWSYPTQGIVLILEAIGCQIKSPGVYVGYVSLSCGSWVSLGPHNDTSVAAAL